MMDENVILLVEDNPKDEALTLRALRKGNIANEVVVARDGVPALDYLFKAGANADPHPLPYLILLDLKLPKLDGHEVLKRMSTRAPDFSPSSSSPLRSKTGTGWKATGSAPTATSASRWISPSSRRRWSSSDYTGWY
jgi:CheY-like chemotaxis protein